jgi:hypothetical protein
MILSNEVLIAYLKTNALGEENVREGKKIVNDLTGEYSVSLDRDLRKSIKQLRERGYPIVSNADGYYWASNSNDLLAFFDFLRCRAFSSLRIVSRMMKIALPDINGQLRLPVGSEPTPIGAIAFEPKGKISLLFEIPVELYEQFKAFMESNTDWDSNALCSSALSLFLLQQGVNSRDLSRIYLSNLKDKDDAID